MSTRLAHNLVRLILVLMVIQLAVICYVFYSGYQRRVDAVKVSRKACERAKHDREDNAKGWRIAEAARRADGEIDVANDYADIASSLEARSKIKCRDAFPDATLFP